MTAPTPAALDAESLIRKLEVWAKFNPDKPIEFKSPRLDLVHLCRDAAKALTTLRDRAVSADTARAAAEAALVRANAQATVLTEAHAAASSMNRSAWSIAERNGADTNWDAFRKQLMHALETSHEALNLLTAKSEPNT